MIGAKKQYDGRDKDIYEYLETHDVYNPPKWPKFDLRGYSKYIEEHNNPRNNVPKEISEMFVIKEADTPDD